MGKALGWVALSLLMIACGEGSPPPGGAGGSAGTAGISGTGGAGTGGTAGTAGSGGVGGCPTGEFFDAGMDANRNMITPAQICQRTAEIQCASERCCCTDNARKFASREQCVSTMVDICVNDLFLVDIAQDSRIAFNAANAAVMFTELERLAGMCDPSVAAFSASTAGFQSVLEGVVASGATCITGSDAPGLASCAGHGACLGETIPSTLTPWTCRPRSALGGECFFDASCADGLRCDPHLQVTASGPSGTCQPRLGIGASCERPSQCESLFCVNHQCAEVNANNAYCLSAQ